MRSTPQEILREGWADIVRETASERERRTQRALYRFDHERRAKKRLGLVPQLVFAVVASAAISIIVFVLGQKAPEAITSDKTHAAASPTPTPTTIATATATAPTTTSTTAPPPVRSVRHQASPPPAPTTERARTVDDQWSEIQSAINRGDRPAAERELQTMLQSIGTTHPRFERASFLLAELELARSEVVAARARLQPLMHSSNDPQMAEDAASLLARSFPSALDRSEIWTRYLATQPPSPRRERALLERARAFERAGKSASAHADVLTLCKTARQAGLVLEECDHEATPSSPKTH